MSQPLETIKRLIPGLPAKDIKYALKFVEEREFGKLLEIIDSDIYLVNQNSIALEPKEKYNNIDIDKLIRLKSEVEEYMSYLEVPDNSDELYDLFYD